MEHPQEQAQEQPKDPKESLQNLENQIAGGKVERVPENPLITRKLLFTRPFTLVDRSRYDNDKQIQDVPAIYLILQEDHDWTQLGDSQGNSVGWVEKGKGTEWNTRLCWKAKEPTDFYTSLDDATNNRDKTAFPKDLPSDAVFPALEICEVKGKQYVKIERPFPPAKVSANFPLWVMIKDHERYEVGQMGVLAFPKELQNHRTSSRVFLIQMEEFKKPASRNKVEMQNLLSIRHLRDYMFITGQNFKHFQNVPDEKILESFQKLHLQSGGTMRVTLETIMTLSPGSFEAYMQQMKDRTEALSQVLDKNSKENSAIKKWIYVPLQELPE